ncbi:hypothetical protein MD484_g1026, partial [Candolleomyces efflorescens]
MPPNSKRRGLRPIFVGLRSLFSSSNKHPQEKPVDFKKIAASQASDLQASVTGREPAEIMTGAATTCIDPRGPRPGLPCHDGGADPSTSEGAGEASMIGAASTGQSNAFERPRFHSDHTQAMSIFPNLQNGKFSRVTFNSSQNIYHSKDSRKAGWDLLVDNVASNALHDSNARFDAPKCDEDTRVEVTKELMDWIEDREGPKRLLCMTGAAGAGKSALQQTIAVKCSESKILGSAFFFSAGDPTRNGLTHIVPTIACQLGQHSPVLRNTIGKAIEEDPLIFKKTLGIQMDTLIVTPFKYVCSTGELDPNTFPHAILIDGLDECVGEVNQAELLSTIKHCLLDNDLPFRIFISSRPEWSIRVALSDDPEGYFYPLTYHIKLSDQYDATADIRRYLWRRLQDIGSRSLDRRAQPHLWPTSEDVENLVAAASGQFVYAATIVKYVSERHSSPVDRLRTVIEWTPHGAQHTRPFEALDILYRSILSVAKELYEAVDTNHGRDFLMLIRAHQINSEHRTGFGASISYFQESIGLEEGGHQALFSDLHSLVYFSQDPDHQEWEQLYFYHRSFSEFLDSESRAQYLFVSEARVYTYVVETCLQKITQRKYLLDSCSRGRMVVILTHYFDLQITHVDGSRLVDFTRNNGWGRIDKELQSSIPFNWPTLACFTFNAMQRLNDELHEPGLVDIVKTYFEKWNKAYPGWEPEVPRQASEDKDE